MKVAVSSIGKKMEDSLDTRFGRASYFLVVDTDSMTFNVLDNSAQSNAGGAGIAAAQLVIDSGAQAVITGQIGPNAMDVLKSTDLALYQGVNKSIYENIMDLKQNALHQITGSGPAHAGQRR